MISSRCKAGLTVIPNLSASFSPQLQTVPAWTFQCLILLWHVLTKQFLRFTYFHPSGVINSAKTQRRSCVKQQMLCWTQAAANSGWSQCAPTFVSCCGSHAARGTASFLHGHGVWDFYKKALGWGCSAAELLQRNWGNTRLLRCNMRWSFVVQKLPRGPSAAVAVTWCSCRGSSLQDLEHTI